MSAATDDLKVVGCYSRDEPLACSRPPRDRFSPGKKKVLTAFCAYWVASALTSLPAFKDRYDREPDRPRLLDPVAGTVTPCLRAIRYDRR
jgi:hypothetical protein